jgi:cbb3-type cytochrome oxidase maturation protein
VNVLIFLIPIALLLGGIGLVAFLWAIRSGQFEDLDGAAQRILINDDKPLRPEGEDKPAEC